MTQTPSQKRHGYFGARGTQRTAFARARIARGITHRELIKKGFGASTVWRAEKGKLPKHPAIRAALLAAVGLNDQPAKS